MSFLFLKIIIATVIFIALAGAAVVFKWVYPVRSSTEFAGSVQKIEGSHLYAEGVFTVPGHLREYYDPSHKKSVNVLIGPDTEIIKMVRYNLPINGQAWDHTKFKTENTKGNLKDLIQGMPIKVTSSENIFNKSQFTASKIEYTQDISFE